MYGRPARLRRPPLLRELEEKEERAAATDLRCRPPPRPHRNCCSWRSPFSRPLWRSLLWPLGFGPRPPHCPCALQPQRSCYIARPGRRGAEPRRAEPRLPAHVLAGWSARPSPLPPAPRFRPGEDRHLGVAVARGRQSPSQGPPLLGSLHSIFSSAFLMCH